MTACAKALGCGGLGRSDKFVLGVGAGSEILGPPPALKLKS